ncbi:MAG: alpha/beta hydrolase [Acidimicrobiales bacterium]
MSEPEGRANGDIACSPRSGESLIGAPVVEESPVYFPAGDHDLFGIVTSPPGDRLGLGAVLLSGASWTPSPGRNRIWVRLARGLADAGIHAIRIDYQGVGESSGELLRYRMADPLADNVLSAVECLRERGVSDVVLLGTCYGGRAALAAATEITGLRGVAAYASPLRDYEMKDRITSLPGSWYMQRAARWRTIKGLLDPEKRQTYRTAARRKLGRVVRGAKRRDGRGGNGFEWTSPFVLAQLRELVDRRVPVLLVFGEDDDMYLEYRQGRSGPLGDLVRSAGDLLTVQVEPGKVHGLRTNTVQERVIAVTIEWLAAIGATRQ